MNARRRLTRLEQNLYYATLPWCNLVINAAMHGRLSRQFIPKVIYVETTNRCNAKCLMCPHEKMKRPRGHMEWDLFTAIVDQCAQIEGRGLKLFLHKDGEPLMDPMLFERIAYAKDRLRRTQVHFNSNASLLTEDKAAAILDSPLDSIIFSVDGASAETYEKIRIGLSYDRTVANIERFFEMRAERGRGPKASLQMVVSDINRHEMDAYRGRWEGKADRVVFKPMHNFLVQETSVHGKGLDRKQRYRCGMPFNVMLFYCNGDMGLCCWDYDHIVELGSIREQSLLSLYNSDRMSRIRRAMRRMDCSAIDPCNRCSRIYGRDASEREIVSGNE